MNGANGTPAVDNTSNGHGQNGLVPNGHSANGHINELAENIHNINLADDDVRYNILEEGQGNSIFPEFRE